MIALITIFLGLLFIPSFLYYGWEKISEKKKEQREQRQHSMNV